MITIEHKGDFRHAETWLKKLTHTDLKAILEKYAQAGVDALSKATPRDTGQTAGSWSYSVSYDSQGATIDWLNSNVNKGVNIALILQYGHGTGTGGYVQGLDYINPALQPVFEKMADELWREVTKL